MVVSAIGLLLAAEVMYLCDRDWASVVHVTGHDIDRAAVRDRTAVLTFAAADRASWIETLKRAGRLDGIEAASLQAAVDQTLADPRTAAIDDLVDAALVADEARADGSTAPPADPAEELLRSRLDLTDRRLAWIRLAWVPSDQTTGPPSEVELAQVGAELRASLASESMDAVAERYRTAGWSVTTDTRWLPVEGPVAGLDPEVVAAARSAPKGPMEPIVGTGWVTVADVVDIAELPPASFGASLLEDARATGVSDTAIQAWAADRAEARTLATSLLDRWSTTTGANVRAAEVVLGPAVVEGATGPWVELAHLAVHDLPADRLPAGGDPASALAANLATMSPVERRAQFLQLMAAARGATGRSGELGYFVREQLNPALGAAAFAPDVTTGTVLGPIATDAGPELFLVEAQYAGPLDDRSIGALIELQVGQAGPLDVARTTSPNDAALATGGPWRNAAEFPAGSAAATTLFTTPVGALSDPFVLEGRLEVAQILERREGVPNAAAMARLSVDGFDTWLAAQRASAEITYAPGESIGPSTAPRETGLPTMLPQATPRLPVTPGVPVP